MRRTPKYWILLTLGLCLLSVGSTVAIVYWRHTVPLSQTSEVYRRYRDLPGIRAAYIRQMPINDTLRLDMTLFEAEDSLSYTNFLRTIGKREEFIRDIMSVVLPESAEIVGSCRRGYYGSQIPDPDNANNEVTIIMLSRLVFSVIHTHTANEVRAVQSKGWYGRLDIDQR